MAGARVALVAPRRRARSARRAPRTWALCALATPSRPMRVARRTPAVRTRWTHAIPWRCPAA
eukprot:8526863-Alexandrium_andersonii.AAC.1